MEGPFLILIFFAAAIAALTALSIRGRQKREAARIRREIAESWGSPAEAVFNTEYGEALKKSGRGGTAFGCDDITWNDLDIERLYRRIASTRSSCGDVVLYDRLKHPCLEVGPLREYDRVVTGFAGNEKLRNRVLTALSGIGRPADRTILDELDGVRTVNPIGRRPYAILAALTIADLVFLFIFPLPAVLIFIGLTVFNIVLSLRMKETIGPAIRGFRAALKLMSAAEDLSNRGLGANSQKAEKPDGSGSDRGSLEFRMDGISEYIGRMEGALAELRTFKAGSSLVTGRDRVADGLVEALLQYVNLLIHLDLLKFDQMLAAFKEHEDAVYRLHDEIGYLDAACATASYRESVKIWCRPVFKKTGDQQTDVNDAAPTGGSAPELSVRGLCHPLLSDPVPVTTDISGGMLVTGSNASGKSTFLKEIALASLMAQTIATVTAEDYRAPFVRLMTSMALTDNLAGGESYYIVEIRSIRRILEAIAGGEPVLAVVDEVLKGTNTIERVAASSEILKAMIRPNSLILAATHDRELTEILGNLYSNKHFEETVTGDDIQFTYELMDGPASTRNAIRLLEAEGYDPAIVSGARKAAEHFEETGVWADQAAADFYKGGDNRSV